MILYFFCFLYGSFLLDEVDIIVKSGIRFYLLISVRGSRSSRIVVSPVLVEFAHQLHPGVVLAPRGMAPHTTRRPHNGGPFTGSRTLHQKKENSRKPHHGRKRKIGRPKTRQRNEKGKKKIR
uniref:Secreted protein n=1 Tax=Cacopsylla melanoneura TaxID=428564 RepID=A0A8D9B748_9HEMI